MAVSKEAEGAKKGDGAAGEGVSPRRKWGFLSIVSAAVVLLDQGTKVLMLHLLREHSALPPLVTPRPGQLNEIEVIPGFLKFYLRTNKGAAWGFLNETPDWFRRPFFIVVSLAAVGFIFWLYRKIEKGQRLLATALALVLGGALGNFVDRAVHGRVVDFIHADLGSFTWPTFNIADSGITIGVVLLLYEMFLSSRRNEVLEGPKKKKRAKQK
jgi:signal peptidase II